MKILIINYITCKNCLCSYNLKVYIRLNIYIYIYIIVKPFLRTILLSLVYILFNNS